MGSRSQDRRALASRANSNLFVSAVVWIQAGFESFLVGIPEFLRQTLGEAAALSRLPDIGIASIVVSLAGRMTAAAWIPSWGLKRTYVTFVGASLFFMGLQLGIAGLAIVAPLILLISMGGFKASFLASGIAQTGISAVLEPNQLSLERLQGRIRIGWQLCETLIPAVGGPLMAWLGPVPLLVSVVIFYGIGIAYTVFLRVPSPRSEPPARRQGFRGFIGECGRSLSNGWHTVWRNPLLRTTVLAYSLIYLFNPLIFDVLAFHYASFLSGSHLTGAVGGQLIYTAIFSAFGLGGLVAGISMARQRESKNHTNNSLSPQDIEFVNEASRQSMLKWMKRGIWLSAAVATLAIPLAPLGAAVALPASLGWIGGLTIPVAAFFLFGIAYYTLIDKIKSFFLSRLPGGDRSRYDAIGIFGAAFMLSSGLAVALFKFPFTGELPFLAHKFMPALTGSWPFLIASTLTAALAIVFRILTWRIEKLSAPAFQGPRR